MKGYFITDEKKLELLDVTEDQKLSGAPKIKTTKALITLPDVLRYNGEIFADNIVLGSTAVGIVSQTEANLFDLEKGKHVYIEPNTQCGECYNCINGDYLKCSDMYIAGEDTHGFLRDFASAPAEKLFTLPDNVTDFDALFIKHISLAIDVIDKLNVQKGDYVAVIGGNNFGNILSQLLIYYSAVPILMTTDEEDFQTAKKSGVYYVLGAEDNWKDEVFMITSGRMAEKVIYISDCNIPVIKAFNLASFGAQVAFTGSSYKNSPITFTQAIKKQLDILCINSGFGNTAASINIISNKAINLSHLPVDKAKFEEVPQVFEKLSKQLEETGKIRETLIEL